MTTLPPNLSAALLDTPIVGLHLRAATLGAQIRSAPSLTLMVFLRHYGCIFCKEMVRDLKAASAADPGYPDLLFFGQGDMAETEAFANKLWPEMAVVSDPDRKLYTAMGLGKGSIYQMFGPRVWACGVRAGFKGNFQHKIVGDVWTMPGAFAVDQAGTLLWSHTFEHAGHHPNWKTLPNELAKGTRPGAGTTVLPTTSLA